MSDAGMMDGVEGFTPLDTKMAMMRNTRNITL